MRIGCGMLLFATSLLAQHACLAAWETSGDWKVVADDSLLVHRDDRGAAWNPSFIPGRSWSVFADLKVGKANQVLIASAQFVFGNARRQPLLVVSLRRRSGKLAMVEVESVSGSKLRQALCSNWMPGGDEAFAVRLSRVGRSLKIVVYGDKHISYAEQTPELPAELLDATTTFGLGAEASDAEFSNIKFQSPWPEPAAETTRSEAAVGDLLAHYWTGGLDQGCIVPTSHGYAAPDLPNPRGGIWERAMMVFAMDTLHRATGEPTIARRLKTEWNRLKQLYSVEELEAAGGALHPASDDAGWDAMLYLVLYRHTGDRDALDRAKGLVSNSFRQWLDDDLGGGLWYDNERKIKSLYAVALTHSALKIAEATSDADLKDKALACYQWMEDRLLRTDGLYWADHDRHGPLGENAPEHISEAGSVTFLAGNMGMGVLHARLYRMTGDPSYLQRAIRTAEAIAKKLTEKNVYLNDRDAWTNGAFVADWAQEVLSLPGVEDRHRELLRRTADSIYRQARTPQGYYGGSWSGPAEGPGSRWCMVGSRPQQLMTSANSVNMIAAAALVAPVRPQPSDP